MTTPAHAPQPLSGRQLELTLDDQRLVVTDVGAKVRVYSVGGRDVFTPFGEDEPAPAGHGAVLAPWPNRLRDGVYAYAGQSHQLAITEPERGTALHGLVMWQRWATVPVDDAEHAEGRALTLELRTSPGAGYPFDLLLSITYRLTAAGLHVQATATNLGAHPAPYGIGFHPWLSPGPDGLDAATLSLDAATRVLVDDRLLPTGTAPVSGRYDLRSPVTARGLDLDDAFVDLIRDEDGLSWAQLAGADGRTAAIWMDESMDTWQVCSGDHLGDPAWRRTGMAAEPQSCIADAFRTGDRLVHLAPGASHEVTWGLTLS